MTQRLYSQALIYVNSSTTVPGDIDKNVHIYPPLETIYAFITSRTDKQSIRQREEEMNKTLAHTNTQSKKTNFVTSKLLAQGDK